MVFHETGRVYLRKYDNDRKTLPCLEKLELSIEQEARERKARE